MTSLNLGYLQKELKFFGFGEKTGLSARLEEKSQTTEKEFSLHGSLPGKNYCTMNLELFFRQGDKTENYFFNKYRATLSWSDGSGTDRSQFFYIFRGAGVTCKEAFNLLEGRSVYRHMYTKTGEKYYSWLLINFKERMPDDSYKMERFYDSYGYDLVQILSSYNIREMELASSQDSVIRSLKKGNIQAVTIGSGDKAKRMLIEACPKYKTINLFPDLQTQPIRIDDDVLEVDTDAGTGSGMETGMDELIPDNEDRNLSFWDDDTDETASAFGNKTGSSRRRKIAKKKVQ